MSKALASEVFMHGRIVSSPSYPHFLIKTAQSPEGKTSPTRFAVSISKKIAPTAVLRNRTRRRVYSVIQNLWPRVVPGLSVAISVKKGGEKLTYEEIAKELGREIEKSAFLK